MKFHLLVQKKILEHRFFLEFLREPDSHIGLLLNYFTMGQFLCAPMIIFGLIIYIGLKKNDKK